MFIFIMSIFGSGVITSHDQYIVITKWDDPMYMTDFKRSLTLASTVMYSMYEPKQFDLITNKTLFYLLTFYYALTIILMSTNSHKNTCIQRRVKKFIDNIIKTLTSNLVCMTRFWNIKFGWSIINIYTLPDHLSSLPVFSGVCVTRSLVLCVCLVDHCWYFCPFIFDHGVVCPSSIYGL